MWQLSPGPLTADTLLEQLEMLGGRAVVQGKVLQYSRLEYHFAFCTVDLPAGLRQRLDDAGQAAQEMRTLHIDAGVPVAEQADWAGYALVRGLEYQSVADADAAFSAHLDAVEGGLHDRILVSLRLTDSAVAVVSDYIV